MKPDFYQNRNIYYRELFTPIELYLCHTKVKLKVETLISSNLILSILFLGS